MAAPEKSLGEFQAAYDNAYSRVRKAREINDSFEIDKALDELSVARDNLLLAQPAVEPKPKGRRW